MSLHALYPYHRNGRTRFLRKRKYRIGYNDRHHPELLGTRRRRLHHPFIMSMGKPLQLCSFHGCFYKKSYEVSLVLLLIFIILSKTLSTSLKMIFGYEWKKCKYFQHNVMLELSSWTDLFAWQFWSSLCFWFNLENSRY